MRIAAVLILSLSLQPLMTMAMDKNGDYAVWGMGRKSCYSYDQARASGDYGPYKDYLMGYLTAYNVMTEDTYLISGKMNLEEILEWMDDYCESRQMNSFELALADFIREHRETRLKNAPYKPGP